MYQVVILLLLYVLVLIKGRPILYERGISLCAGSHIFKDALYVIDQIRTVFNNSIPIAINHCNELSDNHIDQTYGYVNIFEWNLCHFETFGNKETGKILSMERGQIEKKLRGFFCKTAALILSPFNETMIIDLDVILFKNPEILFNSPAYKRTSSLFFRDRVAFQAKKVRKDEVRYQEILRDFIIKESNMKNITNVIAYNLSIQNGHSFFWKNIADENAESLIDFQDSSIILMDKRRFPKTLEVLERLLPTFSLGWGDKEIYWIAATIAEEKFSFEPFLATFYGDCTSILLHFDPTQEHDPIDQVGVMYINAEWVLEKVSIMGNWIEEVVSYATFVNESIVLKTLNNNHNMHCSCPVYKCRNVTEEMNLLVLRAQFERLTRSMSRFGPERDCIKIYKPSSIIVENMLQKYIYSSISSNKCKQFGCVYLPIIVNRTFDWFSDVYCDPIIFDNPINEHMKNLSIQAMLPPTPLNYTEGDLIKFATKSVYLIRNGTLHEFPNADTFLAMGYEWNQISNFPEFMKYFLHIGEPLHEIK